MTPHQTGSRAEPSEAERGAEAVMAFIAGFRRANHKSSWRRSTFRNAGLSKRKFRRCLNEFVDGVNRSLDGVAQ